MTATLRIRSKLALVLCTMMSGPALAASAQATQGVVNEPCPSGAVAVTPGRSIQTAVNQAGPNAVFCLKKGIHRAQAVRPRAGQSFYGEGETVLNGSRLLTDFRREGSYWVANSQTPCPETRRMPAERARLRPARSGVHRRQAADQGAEQGCARKQ